MRGAITQTKKGVCKPHKNGEECQGVQVKLGHYHNDCVESAAAGRAGAVEAKQVVEAHFDADPAVPNNANAGGKSVSLGGQEPPEPGMVPFADARSDEVAVMIERGDASLAGVAVLGPKWSLGRSIGRQTVLALSSVRVGPYLLLAGVMASKRNG